ncbi:hypothetical protein M422DRAFT_23646 [Sphaerobolus stellatus SS14]|nr:hypothetical protein M422DRAFT_23646 [Sphaerobolus stellatus SS14]
MLLTNSMLILDIMQEQGVSQSHIGEGEPCEYHSPSQLLIDISLPKISGDRRLVIHGFEFQLHIPC